MKKYTVKVNGVDYDVEIEEVHTRPSYRSTAPGTRVPRQSAPRAESRTAGVPAPATASAGANAVAAPMPGTIVAIKVTAGQSVKGGETLMVLEAMKMENEIVCPRDGTVSVIHCGQGDYVTTGAPLCDIV